MKLLFDLDVRHHFAADFAETTETVSDGEETVFVLGSDVAGDIPAVLQDVGGFFRFAEIALHHVWSANEQQSGRAGRERLARVGIDNTDADAGKRMADPSALGADLAETGGAEIAGVHGNNG